MWEYSSQTRTQFSQQSFSYVPSSPSSLVFYTILKDHISPKRHTIPYNRLRLLNLTKPKLHCITAKAEEMATKRKSMVGGSAPAISDEHVEQGDEDEDLNMSDDEEGGTRIGDIYIPPPVKPYCSTESIGPRLIITKISNCNFKSYAGEVVLGPFSNVSFTDPSLK